MGQIILTVLLVIILLAAVIGIVMTGVKRCALDGKEEKQRLRKYQAACGVIIVLAIGLFLLLNCFTIVPTGSTGIAVRFGQIQEEGLSPGVHGKIPFVDSIVTINNKQQDRKYEGQIWSETSSRTALYYENVTVTYQVEPAASTWIYRNVTDYDSRLVDMPLVSSAVKTASRTLSDEVATERSIIERLTKEKLQEALDEKYEADAVTVLKVVIENADFEDSYNQAIADKQAAKLAYEKQEIVNKQNVEKAEADAEAKIRQAEGEAKAKRIAAEAEANANKVLADSLSKDIFTQNMLEKWNGELPRVVGDGQAVFDISGMIDASETQPRQ